MTVVVDSNVIAAIVIEMPYSTQSHQKLYSWLNNSVRLLAPTLFEYEIATIVRRFVTAKIITEKQADNIIDMVLSIDIEMVAPTTTLHHAALAWAARTGQAKAYDAHYLALAEQENAEFWTSDKRLVNGVRQLGHDWVHSISED